MTDPLNSIVDDFGILFLGYGIELCCLYIPQWHYCIFTLLLWNTD